MNVSVFGLGYVGTVCAGCLAAQGHTVVGVDVNTEKVHALNAGTSPITEPKLDLLISRARTLKRLWATTSPLEAVLASDVSLVCVGTPSRMNGSLDLTYLIRLCEDIGTALRVKSPCHLVVFRSTMLPSTTDDVAIPILEKFSGKKAGQAFGICYNPEFLREGSSVDDFYNPPKTVIGESDAASGELLLQLYAGIIAKAPVVRTSIRVAEMVKYADNAFHALKVCFANEIGNLSKSMGIDSHEVMSIFCQDTKLNLSPAYLKPGFAFGGSCLPKDLRALTYKAKDLDLEAPVLNAVLHSNALQIKLLVQKILSLGKKRIGFLGLAFKPQTDDLRESPLVEVVETLLGKGSSIQIYDRTVSEARLTGANKRFIDERIPHLSALLVDRVEDLIEHAEVVVVGHKSQEHAGVVKRLTPAHTVIDLVRLDDHVESSATYYGISW